MKTSNNKNYSYKQNKPKRIASLVLLIIKLYQKVSPVVLPSNTCRFQPTCSQYTAEAIAKYGVVKGFVLGLKRVSRCHPWNQGGVDPV